jgi:hypothetical protein
MAQISKLVRQGILCYNCGVLNKYYVKYSISLEEEMVIIHKYPGKKCLCPDCCDREQDLFNKKQNEIYENNQISSIANSFLEDLK